MFFQRSASCLFGRYGTTAAMAGLQSCMRYGLALRVREVRGGEILVVCVTRVMSKRVLVTTLLRFTSIWIFYYFSVCFL